MSLLWREGDCCSGVAVDGCKLFSQGAGSELSGRSIPYLLWSGNNNLYVPYVLMLYCLVMSLVLIL